jgi:hypothetical protein
MKIFKNKAEMAFEMLEEIILGQINACNLYTNSAFSVMTYLSGY